MCSLWYVWLFLQMSQRNRSSGCINASRDWKNRVFYVYNQLCCTVASYVALHKVSLRGVDARDPRLTSVVSFTVTSIEKSEKDPSSYENTSVIIPANSIITLNIYSITLNTWWIDTQLPEQLMCLKINLSLIINHIWKLKTCQIVHNHLSITSISISDNFNPNYWNNTPNWIRSWQKITCANNFGLIKYDTLIFGYNMCLCVSLTTLYHLCEDID